MPPSSRWRLGFVFPRQSSVCVPLRPHACHTLSPSHSTSLHDRIFIQHYEPWSSSLRSFLHCSLTSCLLDPSTVLGTVGGRNTNIEVFIEFQLLFVLCDVTTGRGVVEVCFSVSEEARAYMFRQKNQITWPRGSQYDLRPCGRPTSFCTVFTGM